MILRKRLQPRATIGIGMLALAAAILSVHFLHPSAAFSADLIDATEGFLYGISIVFLVCGMVLRRRKGSASKAGPCS
jgi:hypothetical protein